MFEQDRIPEQKVGSVSFTEKEWFNFVEKKLQGFDGDREQAAKLLFKFSDGVNYVVEELSKEDLDIAVPRIIVLINEEYTFASVAGTKSGIIWLTKEFLEMSSEYDDDHFIELPGIGGEIAFRGRMSDFFRLSGVEECFEDFFKQNGGKEEDASSVETLAEYDALEHEFASLQFRLKYAREKDMHPLVVQDLAKRLENAMRIRESRT